ncbi:MAG: hypothetical protein LBE35_08330, partial [Clostridiales bacterium]|nr:hypothetical protein [Clostridiales bacterium]
MIHLTGQNIKIDRPTAVAIGKFDGVHRGHMALLTELKRVAKLRGLQTLVLTFSPHPIAFFRKTHLPLILDPKEKLELFESLQFDYYLEYTFDDVFAQRTAEEFMREILCRQLQARAMVVAEGYRFGRGGAGDVALAERVGAELGIEVQAIGHVVHEGHKISSDYLRGLISEKNFALTQALLGRKFSIKGRAEGSPPAIIPHPDKLLPPDGIYNTTICLDNKAHKSVAEIA